MISSITFEAVIRRLRDALDLRSDKEVAAALGMKPNAFYNRRRLGSLPYDELMQLAEKRNLRADWLLFGIDTPHRTPRGQTSPHPPNVDPYLMGQILQELERAWGLAGIVEIDRAEAAAKRGILAAQIFNKCYLLEDEKSRHALARREAESLAVAQGAYTRLTNARLAVGRKTRTTNAKVAKKPPRSA